MTGRKLVTLPLDTIERAETYRSRFGAPSESEALRALIEVGLSRFDTRADVFERCQKATTAGESIGDVITSILADHPLVKSTSIDGHSVHAVLSPLDPDDRDEEMVRFRFSRLGQKWSWESYDNRNEEWVASMPTGGTKSTTANRPSVREKPLDDDIPF